MERALLTVLAPKQRFSDFFARNSRLNLGILALDLPSLPTRRASRGDWSEVYFPNGSDIYFTGQPDNETANRRADYLSRNLT